MAGLFTVGGQRPHPAGCFDRGHVLARLHDGLHAPVSKPTLEHLHCASPTLVSTPEINVSNYYVSVKRSVNVQ